MLALDWTIYDRVTPVKKIHDEELQQDLKSSAFLFFLSREMKTVQLHMRPVDGKIATILIDTQDKSSLLLVDNTIIARGNLLQVVTLLRKQKVPAITDYELQYHDGHLSISYEQ